MFLVPMSITAWTSSVSCFGGFFLINTKETVFEILLVHQNHTSYAIGWNISVFKKVNIVFRIWKNK